MSISQMEFEIKQTPEVLGRLLMGQQQFETAVARIKSSSIKSVMIAARGTSDNAAHYLKHLIEVELGIPVGLASPSVVSIYGAKLHYSETLVIALSQSGQSPDLVAFVKAARDGGALTLGITNDANSTLAKSVELHLDLLADREIAVAATKSYTMGSMMY
ncbi:MAG: SIS domain-containing protein [Actinobacteria bacterium]|nr:SIS domain-containing protein [Actinomycetota bacterium]